VKIADKLDAIDRIGRVLQSRFGYREIDAYLRAFGLGPPEPGVGSNSKWVYSKAALNLADIPTIGRILDDLEMDSMARIAGQANPPAHWRTSDDLRLFISHVSKDKAKALRLKDCLASYSISGFVAHEDIEPTKEWQSEIERALFAMDALVAVHTPGFKDSVWTNQEIGFALGRGVKVISFKIGEDPAGFISKHQALSRGTRTAEEIAKQIDALLAADPLTADRLGRVPPRGVAFSGGRLL
jgi:hypothetical protein